MEIERTQKEILIRISTEFDTEKLRGILDMIRYGELTSKSTARQKDVDKLAGEVNKSWWKKNRSRFLK